MRQLGDFVGASPSTNQGLVISQVAWSSPKSYSKNGVFSHLPVILPGQQRLRHHFGPVGCLGSTNQLQGGLRGDRCTSQAEIGAADFTEIFTILKQNRDGAQGWHVFSPQTVCPHWGVLTVSVKRLVLDQGAHSGRSILPVNFCIKWLLWNLDMRFDCAGLHKVCSAVLVCRILPLNFCIKWPLWNLDLRFYCAGSHKVFLRVLGSAFYL